MNKNFKENIQVWTAVGMLVAGVTLVFAGFIVPPLGEVSESVLWFFAQCLIYAGSIFGISIYVSGQLKNIRKQLNIDEK